MTTRELGPPPRGIWRIPRVRYERMVEAGAFEPEDRIELLDGFLMAREPQGSRHAVAVGLVRTALERVFGRGYHVREEKPLALDALSEPEPDLVVVHGRPRDYRDAHPSTPVLMVEVADRSLRLDRLRKGSLYAPPLRLEVSEREVAQAQRGCLAAGRSACPHSGRRSAAVTAGTAVPCSKSRQGSH